LGRFCRLLLVFGKVYGWAASAAFCWILQGLWVAGICRLLLVFGKVYGWAASAASTGYFELFAVRV
jgi:hypothetical protein